MRKTNCSTRDIVKAIERLADLTFGLVDNVPSYNTIDYWTRKCGLDELKHTPEALKDIDYAVIIDECMMIGSEKLLPYLPCQPNIMAVRCSLMTSESLGLTCNLGG